MRRAAFVAIASLLLASPLTGQTHPTPELLDSIAVDFDNAEPMPEIHRQYWGGKIANAHWRRGALCDKVSSGAADSFDGSPPPFLYWGDAKDTNAPSWYYKPRGRPSGRCI